MSLSQLLTVAVGSLEAAEIAPFARSKARDKESHGWRLGQLRLLRFGRRCRRKHHHRNYKCA
jgi:hypothetical protein